MTIKLTAAAIAKAILLQFFIVLFALTQVSACDSDSFVFEEFGQRSQNLSDLLKQLQISYKMNLPDQEKLKRIVLNEWVDFFLDHGNSPPGGFAQIATTTWKATLEMAGQQIGRLTYRKIAVEETDSVTVPFDLLAQPKKFVEVRETIASWTVAFEEPMKPSIRSEGIWLGRNVTYLAQIMSLAAATCPNEKARVKKMIAGLSNDWKFVLDAGPEVANTVFRFSSKEIRLKLKRELEHWRKLSFM